MFKECSVNNEENHKLDVLIERVDWVRGDINELKKDFKCRYEQCTERMDKQDTRINKISGRVWWILGVVATGGITTGTIIGVT